MNKKLCKSANDTLIAGVCGGIGEYFNIDSNIVRLIFVIFGLFGAGILVYILLWIFLPVGCVGSSNDSEETFNGSKVFNMDKDGNVFKMVNQKNNKNTIAIVILVIGCLFLLNNFFNISKYLNIFKIWPLLLIAFGFILLFRKDKNN